MLNNKRYHHGWHKVKIIPEYSSWCVLTISTIYVYSLTVPYIYRINFSHSSPVPFLILPFSSTEILRPTSSLFSYFFVYVCVCVCRCVCLYVHVRVWVCTWYVCACMHACPSLHLVRIACRNFKIVSRLSLRVLLVFLCILVFAYIPSTEGWADTGGVPSLSPAHTANLWVLCSVRNPVSK